MKLKNIDIRCENKAGEAVEFISKINVANSGMFSLSFPDEIEDYARNYLKNINAHKHKESSFYINRPNKKHLYLYHDNLDQGGFLLQKICEGYLACEATEQDVIVYGHKNNVKYCKDKTGEIGPNGYFVNDANCAWRGSLDATHDTEEAAKFFYNMMMALCHLADRFEEFFKDEQHLIASLPKGNNLIPLLPIKDIKP